MSDQYFNYHTQDKNFNKETEIKLTKEWNKFLINKVRKEIEGK